MNRTAGLLLVVSSALFVYGVSLYSDRLAVLAGAFILAVAGVGAVDVKDRRQ